MTLKPLLDVETNWEEGVRCGICREGIAEEAEMVWEPRPEMGQGCDSAAHTVCAMGNGYRVRWPS